MYRPRRRGRLLLLAFLALSVLVITLDFRGGDGGPLERAKEITQAIVAPIQRGVTAITRPVGNFFSSIADLANLREENGRLRNEVEELTREINQARELAKENAELREFLDLAEPWYTMDAVTAQVIADAPGNYSWAVTISRGADDGVETDMAVITPQGLVGKVINVNADEALVLLLIDPQLGVGATTGERRLLGTVSGNGEGVDLSLNYVSKSESVVLGDNIYTSNRNRSVFPPGIPIGHVSGIGGDARDPNYEISIRPAVDFTTLNFVQVLLETGSGNEGNS